MDNKTMPVDELGSIDTPYFDDTRKKVMVVDGGDFLDGSNCIPSILNDMAKGPLSNLMEMGDFYGAAAKEASNLRRSTTAPQPEPTPHRPKPLKVGDGVIINGIPLKVKRVTPKEIVLRRLGQESFNTLVTQMKRREGLI